MTETVCTDNRFGYLRMSPDFTGQDDKGAEDDISLCVSIGLLAPD